MARASPEIMAAPARVGRSEPKGERVPNGRSALLVSSFVLPRRGGVEQFVDTASTLLRDRGWSVRILACRPGEGPVAADITVPTRFLPPAGWPIPLGGWHTLWREIGAADVVIANGTRQILPNAAVVIARMRGRAAVFVLHGSGAPFSSSSFFYHRVLGSLFEWLIVRQALRLARPISLSRAGVEGARRRYGVDADYVPYPLRALPPAGPRSLGQNEPLRIVWVGRLYREKNPLLAVSVVERVRRHREATLDVYGGGVLEQELARLAEDRPWLALRGSQSWSRIQDAQNEAHVCLSTSLRDATQIAILEPLARGIPAVSTRVGDAPAYYARGSLKAFCVDPGDPDAAASAILALASSYPRYREEFAANASPLRARHRGAPERLSKLLEATTARVACQTTLPRSSQPASDRE